MFKNSIPNFVSYRKLFLLSRIVLNFCIWGHLCPCGFSNPLMHLRGLLSFTNPHAAFSGLLPPNQGKTQWISCVTQEKSLFYSFPPRSLQRLRPSALCFGEGSVCLGEMSLGSLFLLPVFSIVPMHLLMAFWKRAGEWVWIHSVTRTLRDCNLSY